MKKIFLTGVSGQLGSELSKLILSDVKKYRLLAPPRSVLDLTNLDNLRGIVYNFQPDIIIHCAAYTNVVQAEIDREQCYKENVLTTSNIIKACQTNDAILVYISTDFVFDGQNTTPYNIDDATNPLNFYGKTKLIAENYIRDLLTNFYIVRTSWLFSHNTGNFLTKILKATKSKDVISVVSDEFGSPTSTYFLSKVILMMIEDSAFGTYHVTNQGDCSRYEFAKYIINKANSNSRVAPFKRELEQSSQIRPKYSVLENNWGVTNFFHQHWQDATDEVLDFIRNETI